MRESLLTRLSAVAFNNTVLDPVRESVGRERQNCHYVRRWSADIVFIEYSSLANASARHRFRDVTVHQLEELAARSDVLCGRHDQ